MWCSCCPGWTRRLQGRLTPAQRSRCGRRWVPPYLCGLLGGCRKHLGCLAGLTAPGAACFAFAQLWLHQRLRSSNRLGRCIIHAAHPRCGRRRMPGQHARANLTGCWPVCCATRCRRHTCASSTLPADLGRTVCQTGICSPPRRRSSSFWTRSPTTWWSRCEQPTGCLQPPWAAAG